ncbi:MAG: PDDEXK nuclease domain-containing protein [Methanomassiliicoccaceae archaeon]|nr:PDDEXK nuclease domain-containing protein [Methanomassiliicoccaceae archaeon]
MKKDKLTVTNEKKNVLIVQENLAVDENALFDRISAIIENRKCRAATYANQEITMMFWEVGQYINSTVLNNQRAEYGKKILPTLSAKLTAAYGKSFTERNLYRMALFAERISDTDILPMVSARLSWSHILELLPLKSKEALLYYANEVAQRNLGVHELRRQISRKAYERREIAATELSEDSIVPLNVFKDPYLLDLFGLKENYLEADLEKAILTELESFVLEFGHGFTFVERQKRMIIDGEDIVLDLLFYHRTLKRLVAIELKVGEFKAAHMGQMMLYLKWLNKYERQEGEEQPIGLILCTKASRGQIELLEMDRAGIAVAEYWTHLPPKAELEKKIRDILAEAKERLERRKLFDGESGGKHIDYFYEPKDDD